MNILGEYITEKQIEKKLLNKTNSINKYIQIMNMYNNNEFNTNEFKETYKNLYGMKRCHFNNDFYDTYFNLLNKNVNYNEIIEIISNESGRIEKSFASKLLATKDPNRAVLDTNVLSRLKEYNNNLKINPKTIIEAQKLYKEYEKTLNNIINSPLGNNLIKLFDKYINNKVNYNFTSMKKIDLVLWSLGKKTTS